MSVTMQPSGQLTSAELGGLVAHVGRLADAAGRPDLAEGLAHTHRLLAGRRARVVAIGAPGQGTSSVVRALGLAASDWLPAASFTEAAGTPGSRQIWLPEPGSVDVILFVSEADQEYTAWELDLIGRLRGQGTSVVGVISKIDLYPQWAAVQRGNRQRLQMANLDSPSVPLLPVSVGLLLAGSQRGEQRLVASSGIPQLLEFLRDSAETSVEMTLHDAVLAEVRLVTDQLTRVWSAELERLARVPQINDLRGHTIDGLRWSWPWRGSLS